MNAYAAVAFIASIFTIVIGIAVYFKGQDKALSKSYSLLSVTILLWQLGCFGESYFLQDKNLAYFFDKLIYTGAFFAPVVYVQTVYIAINRLSSIKKLLIAFYSVSFVFLMINWIDSLRSIYFVSDIDMRLGFRYIAAPLAGWYLFFVFYCFVSSFIVIGLLKGLKELDGNNKLRIKYFLFSAVFIVIAGYMYLFLVFSFKVPFAPLDNFFGILYGLIMGYSIIRYRLMDIDVVIKRSTYFVILFLIIIYPLTIAINYLSLAINLGQLGLLLTAFMWSFVFLFIDQIKRFLEDITDRIFFMADYNYNEVLLEMTNRLQEIADIETLVKSFDIKLTSVIKITSMGIFIANHKKTRFHFVSNANVSFILNKKANKSTVKELTVVKANNPIFTEIKHRHKNCILYYELKEEYDREKNDGIKTIMDLMDRICAKLIIGSVTDNEVTGMIAVGEKKSGESFKEKDINLLYTLVNQGALVVARIFEIEDKTRIKTEKEVQEKYSAQLEEKNRLLEKTMEELTHTQNKLVEEEQLSAMGKLSGEVAHDMRNPLSAINRYIISLYDKGCVKNSKLVLADIYKKIEGLGEVPQKTDLLAYTKFVIANIQEIEETLDEVKDINNRLRKIAGDFLEYSKVSRDIPTQKINIRELIESMLGQWETDCQEKGITIIKDIQSDRSVYLFDHQIQKIFTNLFDNAQKAILERNDTNKKEITVRLSHTNHVDNKEWISLAIADTGIGIPEEDQDQVFKPFYTKRKNLQGTGLGLAIIKKIVENHGGRIEMTSTVGVGTTFTVYFPCCE